MTLQELMHQADDAGLVDQMARQLRVAGGPCVRLAAPRAADPVSSRRRRIAGDPGRPATRTRVASPIL
jgi:hypothetical protein